MKPFSVVGSPIHEYNCPSLASLKVKSNKNHSCESRVYGFCQSPMFSKLYFFAALLLIILFKVVISL